MKSLRRAGRTLTGSGLAIGLAVTGLLAPAAAARTAVEPATIGRGADPSVTYLVHDIIHDGALSTQATRHGQHERLWNVRDGYLLQDWLQGADAFRLTFVGTGARAGEKRVIGRSALQMTVAVARDGTRVVWTQGPNDLSKPTVVRVTDLATGRLVAGRMFALADVRALTGTRVLLSRRGAHSPATTVWWTFAHDTITTIADRAVLRADVARDRIVLAAGARDSFCVRVARLSHPDRTLWRSCRRAAYAWSPDGSRVLATHTYFDDVGTDQWLTLRDRNAARLGGITGRFAWQAVWEDDRHLLTLALGDSGQAGIVRCTVAGRCERASRLWNVGTATAQPNFIPPPVVLASN
ncbi:hypothetical protein [Nocardioides cynanchi]|uniref:hypothetical protein n=1 Tax=Nocardioides cynanchi TaxID=2558918 RepID=UPI0012493BEA|nr:hypothetical protein [Nocardioides cynanchi]